MSGGGRRVLVTGADGFVGRHVLPLLLEGGWDVHSVRRPASSGAAQPGLGIAHSCDLLRAKDTFNLVADVRPTHLLHLAWTTEHGAYWNDPRNDEWAKSTQVLASAFATHGGRRFVGAGTCAEYDWTDLRAPCREDETPCSPRTIYGRAKLHAATQVMAIAADAGISATWGRLFLLYGPGEDSRRLIPSVIDALRSGERARVSAGTQVRDFLHVSDVAAAFVALLSSSLEGPVNIGSGVPTTVRAVVEQIALTVGRPAAVDFGAIPMQTGEPPMLVADIARLSSAGWRPQIDLATGLAALVETRAERKLPGG